MAKTIVGSFDSFNEAQRVARELMDEGFASSDINVVASNIRGEFRNDDRVNVTDTNNAATGAVAGGVLGGAAGLAVSLMGLTVPGLGPVIAAGPLAATLSGAGAG
ncbi:MAG TPA: general stress protein, partial [Casimicrobiaceae bacterium]